MKTLAVHFFVFIMISCSGYEMMKEGNRYVEFIEVINLPEDTAFDATLEWMAKNFVDSKEVIQIKDKESHHINATAVGSYYIDVLNTMTNSYYYNLDIKIKNNKIKFDFTTNSVIESGYLPQQRNVEMINENYFSIKNQIINYINNYSPDDF